MRLNRMNRYCLWMWALIFSCSSLALPRAEAQITTSNLVLWLRSDVGVEKAVSDPAQNGDAVSRWLDQSGLGNDATVPGGSTASTFVTGAVNGKPALTFDANTDRLRLPTALITGTNDFTVFSVIRGTGGGERVIGANYGNGNAQALEFYVYQQKLTLYKGTNNVSGDSIVLNSPLVPDDTWVLVEAQRSNVTNFTIRLNYTNALTVAATSSAIPASLNWTIGSGPDYNAGVFGDIAEQIVYLQPAGTLDPFARNYVVDYLNQKYDLGFTVIPEPMCVMLAALGGLLVLRRRFRP